MRLDRVDKGSEFDWGKTSTDYAVHRTGYPESFYDSLAALGIGLPGQRILDVGTGTGVLARAFARRGAVVHGVDIAANQIDQARRLAAADGLEIAFSVSPAEEVDLPDGSCDVISSGQSWLYFDHQVMVPQVLRLLRPEGQLVLTHLAWLPRRDAIARASEALVLEHNPVWGGADYRGQDPIYFRGIEGQFDLKTLHLLDEPLPFTRKGWRGRIRACRGIGASLSQEEVGRFDQEHDALLRRIAPEQFTILHRMSIHAYVRKGVLRDND